MKIDKPVLDSIHVFQMVHGIRRQRIGIVKQQPGACAKGWIEYIKLCPRLPLHIRIFIKRRSKI